MTRKYLLLIILITALSLLLVACGGGDSDSSSGGSGSSSGESDSGSQTSEGDAVAGEPLYQGTCSACHGPDAKGLPSLGKDLTTSEFTHDSSNQELVEFVKVGRPVSDPANTQGIDMPPKGGNPALSDEDILNIIAYLRTLEE